MKKIILFLLLLIIPLGANAMQLRINTEFAPEVTIESIPSIYIELDDALGKGYVLEVFKDKDFKDTLIDFPPGDINVYSATVDLDYINEYPIDCTIDYTEEEIIINLLVAKRELSEEEETHKLDEKYLEAVFGDRYRELKEKYDKNNGVTTTTTTVATENQETTETTTTTVNNEVDNTIDNKEIEKEKEEKKKNLIFKIMFICIGAVIFIGAIYITIKVVGANK